MTLSGPGQGIITECIMQHITRWTFSGKTTFLRSKTSESRNAVRTSNRTPLCLLATGKMRLALALGIALALLNACSPIDTSGEIPVGRPEGKFVDNKRACTVKELLPRPCHRKSSEWTHEYVTKPLYDCTCATMKGR